MEAKKMTGKGKIKGQTLFKRYYTTIYFLTMVTHVRTEKKKKEI